MTIQEIKSRLSLADVLAYYNLKPDRNNMLHCPFHADKNPSMQVYYNTNTVYCFSGNCKTHGKSLDVIDIVMHIEASTSSAYTKHEAIEQCITMIPHNSIPVAITTNDMPLLSKEAFLQRMFTSFKTAVNNSFPAKEYLQSRGLDYKKIEVGYNSAQFHHGSKKSETLIEQCLQVGLLLDKNLKAGTGEKAYQVFGKNCIVFALKNQANEITSLYFRSIVNNPSENSGQVIAKHFYLKDRNGLYPSYPKPETKKLILTEAIIDAATLLQVSEIAEQYSVVACYGTNGLNEEMKNAIKSLTELVEVIFAFDSDEAGNKAVAKYTNELNIALNSPLLEGCPKDGVVFSTLELPCKDINETFLAHDEKILLHLLNERKPLSFLTKNSNEQEYKLAISNGQDTTPESIDSISTLAHQHINSLAHSPISTLNTRNPNKLTYTTETATYSILGGVSKQLDALKVMLQVENTQGLKSRNKIDLYEDKQVEKLGKDVSEKLQLRKDLVEEDIYKLTNLLEQHREKTQGEALANTTPNTQHHFTDKEKTELENFLKKPKVIERLNELLGKTGIVGEERNRIFLLLIAVSYKMKDTLHSLVQGSSGSGKTRLVRQISDCIPPESVTRFTRISDKALYNYPETYFRNRLLVIEDVDGLSEEAEMAFRELQSSGELRSGVSIKLDNGQITSGEKVVSGPVASMSCTTHGETYEDNMSRVFLIAVDESSEQTKRIIQYQNQKASGKINPKEEEEAKKFIQNIIRMLEPKEVINPYAEKLYLPEEAHKIRRLNDLFQNVIKMVTLMNQYQRKKTTDGKLLSEIEDVELAVEVMFESIVLKVDELDGSLRQFFERLKVYLQKHYKDNYSKIEFTQREIRQALNISKAQCSRYFMQLSDLEYMVVKNENNLRRVKYKIDYWDNYTVLRDKIRNSLKSQIDKLKEE